MGHPQGLEIFRKSILQKCMMALLNPHEHGQDDGLQTTVKRCKCDAADKFHRGNELPVEGNAKSPVEMEKYTSMGGSKKISYTSDVSVDHRKQNVNSVSDKVAGLKVYGDVFKEDCQRKNYFVEKNVAGYTPSEGPFGENIHQRNRDHFPKRNVACFKPHDGALKENLKSEVACNSLDGARKENKQRETDNFEGALKSDVDGIKPSEGARKEGTQRNIPRRRHAIRDFPKGRTKHSHHLVSASSPHKDLSKLTVESCGKVERQQKIGIASQHLGVSRDTVKETLNLYREELAKLKQDWKGKKEDVYRAAAQILVKQQKCVSTTKCRGIISGVETGDQFLVRAELFVIGLHRQFLNGIDYMNDENGKKLAVSVVDSGRYDNYSSDDVLIYTGEGGNPGIKCGKSIDQKLQGGNEALKNSIGKEVRVIRCYKLPKASIVDVKTVYVYDGLYHVESYWQERGKFGKLVFKFHLKRIPDQPKLTWNIGCFSNTLVMK